MRVAVRDDDTCYFTAPEDLERVYGDVWDRIPVCLATVPFAVGYERAGIPEAFWRSGERCALDRNTRLVEYLRELTGKGRATIALHGYTHEDFPGGFEFWAGTDLRRKVREGHAYLEALLQTRIELFVPPHNSLSRDGLDAVRAHRLNILGSFLAFHSAYRTWELRTPVNWWRVRRFRSMTGRGKGDRLVVPWPLRYGGHAEFGCHELIPTTTFDELARGFDEARRFGGDFCLATHHWELDAPLLDILQRFLDHADARGAAFVTAEELFR